MQKKNVPQRCSSIAFDFFYLSSSHHQISCRRVQSIFETTFIKSEACPTMPCISLVKNQTKREKQRKGHSQIETVFEEKEEDFQTCDTSTSIARRSKCMHSDPKIVDLHVDGTCHGIHVRTVSQVKLLHKPKCSMYK